MEADPRHAELVIEQLGLQMFKGVTPPGVDDQEETEDHVCEALDSQAAFVFRGIAARCNYLAADRPDITSLFTEFCQEIVNSPTSRLRLRLKRVGWCLKTQLN